MRILFFGSLFALVVLNACQNAEKSPAPMSMLRSTGTVKEKPAAQPVTANRSLEPLAEKYIDEALKMLGLTRQDPGFKKDHVSDDYRLQKVQDSLHKPLDLPGECDRLDENWRNMRTLSDALKLEIAQLGKWWALDKETDIDIKTQIPEINGLIKKSPAEFRPILKRLLYAIYESRALMEKAFEDLSAD
ncbi:MAG: hypothetical protein KAI63_04340, partial [Planctomycetes bacterium]|nr:hypothetical protein [Planctomycetota bacterium]